jgi:hypothetical protein
MWSGVPERPVDFYRIFVVKFRNPDQHESGIRIDPLMEWRKIGPEASIRTLVFSAYPGVVEEKRKLLVHGILGVARVNSLKRLAFQWSQIATLRAYASQSNSFRRFSFRRFCFRPERKVKILFDESEN